MANHRQYDKISVSVNGKRTKFKVGDRIRFGENDETRCITAISVDSDGCVKYQLTFLNNNVLVYQWMSENDIRIMDNLHESPKVLGFI